jgi:hypothetical protein
VAVFAQAGQHGGFIAYLGVDGVDQQDGRFLARIVAAFEYCEVQQIAVGDAQTLADGRAQGVGGVV